MRFTCAALWMVWLPAAGFGADTRVAEAAMRQDNAAVRALIQQKADLNATLPDGATALHWAANEDDLDTVSLLIQAGANVKAKDRYGFTPLYFAATNGSAAVIRRLLDAG
ncbi:MAG TPA: ankyrin repeat domain-containing protein, partial [Bryobacteraceae bacterium]|nr:ankyrin repeat domain-containing protein [Bryobacteraceae bacterium]